jgi:23S rRNA pseudouridine2605 synthase
MARKSEKPPEPQAETTAATPESAPKVRKSRAKTEKPSDGAKAATAKAKAVAKPKAAAKPKALAKPRKAKVKIKSESGELLDIQVPVGAPFQHSGDDPIGDVSDGEAHASTDTEPESHAEVEAHRVDTTEAAMEDTGISPKIDHDETEAFANEENLSPAIPAKLDRLQKILSQAGIASRRRAEELITEGRVQVNGQVVNQLGFKADATRDHIRVDGKLISGAERHRYFVLNKPKGYVTTVSDPEGRPTVMQFFSKMNERLYPIGRLDYQSEGLLLVTNDGELANQLTKAASGVEKTYLVKVAGQPTEEQLELLRSGVVIDREGPGSGKVHTASAAIRQVRRGDNPWFEVVLIEGRNRELRKMFSAIGHFVEKIRRVGYGPLVLDLEPGKLRELDPEELTALRLAAEGKLKSRRPKTVAKAAKALPKEAGRPASFRDKPSGPGFAKREFKPPARGARPYREQPGRRDKPDWKPREQRFSGRQEHQSDRPSERQSERPFNRPSNRPFDAKPGFGGQPRERFEGRSRFQRDDADSRPPARSQDRGSSFRPQQRDAEPRREDAAAHRPARPYGDRPYAKRPGFEQSGPRRSGPAQSGSRPSGSRPFSPRPSGPRPSGPRPSGFAQSGESPRRFDKPAGKSFGDRPAKTFGKPPSRAFGKGPARSFDRAPARSFDRAPGKPPMKSFDRAPGKTFDKPAGRPFASPAARDLPSKPPSGLHIEPVENPVGNFDKPAGESWSKPAGKTGPAGKTWNKGPARGRDQSSSGRPPRPQGSAPAFRGKSAPRPGGQSRPAPGGGSRPTFGAKSGTKPGSRPGSKSGFKPGGKSGFKSGFKRSGPRPGGNKHR